MSNAIRNLEPKIIWNNFSDLNAVPRASKKEERVIKFMHDFGVNLGLKTLIDEIGNVVIVKPATVGMENRKTVILQSHLDMVLILILINLELTCMLIMIGLGQRGLL